MRFPHLLNANDPFPRTHNALNDFYQFHFREAVRRGDQEPYIWPYRSYGVFILIAYLLLPPTNSRIVHYAFYPVFGYFSYECFRAIFETKSASLAATYGIGIVHSWGILWAASRMLFNDFRTARRVERRAILSIKTDDSDQVGSTTASGVDSPDTAKRRKQNPTRGKNPACEETRAYEYFWQTLPEDFLHRVEWIIDLLFSMRGPGWAHQARSIPGPPKDIAPQLNPPPPSTKSVVREYKERSSLLWANAIRFLKFQVYLDIIKTLMTHDQYFLGFVDPPPPAPAFLPAIIRSSPVLTKWYRLILAMLATRTALGMIFCLSPLFFSGILGPQLMGIRSEPWYYSDFGGDWHYLLSDGIAGWWGAWWHQIFRLGFEAPSKWTNKRLGWSSKSIQGKLLGVLVAFACSGLLHGLASVAMIPETKPWSGPFTFFLLQAVGVIVEDSVGQVSRKLVITQRLPHVVKNLMTILWLATWAYYTGPFLVDDFCRGGVWLFEPTPISVLKMIGFGEPHDHWWRWRARNVFWYTGDRWWKSGIAL